MASPLPNFTVVRLEDIDEIVRLRDDLIAVYHPVDSQELFALEQMALCQQAMLRAARFEAGLFCGLPQRVPDGSARFPLHEDITHSIEFTLAQNRNYMLAGGFFRLPRQGNGFHCSSATKPRRRACTGAQWRNSSG